MADKAKRDVSDVVSVWWEGVYDIYLIIENLSFLKLKLIY